LLVRIVSVKNVNMAGSMEDEGEVLEDCEEWLSDPGKFYSDAAQYWEVGGL
jgi:hypothetical protein